MKTFTLGLSFILILFFFSSFRCSAQHVEAGLMLGTSIYWGDIQAQLPPSQPNDLHPAGGAFVKYHFNATHALRLNVQSGVISADDANSSDPYQQYRNLSFRSRISEVALLYEVDLLSLLFKKESWIRPYAFAGLAVYHYNPKALFQDVWYELQPLHTEGQGSSQYPDRKPYALTNISLPLGGGVEFSLSPRISIGAEINFHRTNTDYLDDVSKTYPGYEVLNLEKGDIAAILSYRHLQSEDPEPGNTIGELGRRGNADTNDGYIFSSITLNYRFFKNSGDIGGPFTGKNGKVKCYRFKNR